MRYILFEERPAQFFEMVPSSAAALFKHLGLKRDLPPDEPLLKIIQIGDFADLCEERCELNGRKHFKLLGFTLNEGQVRIFGAAFETKEELKEYIKSWNGFQSHREIGLKRDLFSSPEEGLWVWHPEGEKIRQQLVAKWKEAHAEQNFQLISTPSLTEDERLHFHAAFGGRTLEIGHLFLMPGKEGMLTPKRGVVETSYIFCREEEIAQEIISSLQSMQKFLSIYDFDYELKESRNLIEFQLFDGLGRRWVGPFIKVDRSYPVIIRSFFGSMERFFALLLENDKLGISIENK